MKMLSIVVPCYNEKETVSLFYEATSQVVEKMGTKYEIIFVNDGSKDSTLEECLKLYEAHKDIVKVIDFSRNFGKEGGLLAGLEYAKGDYITVMDADLQDPPSFLPVMFKTMKDKGVDIVGTRRVSRKGEPPIRSFFARQFYKLINKFSDVEIVDGARDYRLMTRQVVDEILRLKEYHRFSKGIFSWVGFKTEYLEYENVERVAGETSWSFWKLLVYAIEGIIAFTVAPLRIATFFGLFISFFAFASMIFVMVRAALFGDPVSGWPSMVTIMLFLGGIQLIALGIIGEYLSKTYMEVKRRPNYIVRKIYE
ncbi:glycosyltransferase family 2 protein [Anaerorhabdus sp.]|uniref:glycosyltransferase family 2 protein n=1 Tax=Anaerorhabdus sp. TaxID=1872524 RepID=UPI003FA5EEC9